MSMRFLQRSSKLLAAAAVLYSCGSLAAEAATIVPTGGSLRGGVVIPTDIIPAQYGNFSAHNELTFLSDLNFPVFEWVTATGAETSGSVTPDTVHVSGAGYSYTEAEHFYAVSGSIGATIGFDLTDPALVRYSLTQIRSTWTNITGDVEIALRDATGALVLGCKGDAHYYSQLGGCGEGSFPSPREGDDFFGALQLAAGHYDLTYSVSGSAVTSVPVQSQFDFKLTTVPLPASAWLLVSGLGWLARRRRASVEA